jgi:hypothetical protein
MGTVAIMTRSAAAGRPCTFQRWAVDAAVAPGAVALLAADGAVLAGRRQSPAAVLAATSVTIFAFIATGQPGSSGRLESAVAFCPATYLGCRVAALILAGEAP